MYYLYICRFKNLKDYMKIGISTNLDVRTNMHQMNWDELMDDSIYFELPTKEDMIEIECIIKRMLRKHRDECRDLEKKDGFSEFYPIRFYDYVVEYVKNFYIGIFTGDTLKLSPIKLEVLDKEESSSDLKLGQLIKRLRLQRDITQIELADACGIALNVVKRIESSEKGTITALLKILNYLGYTDWMNTLNGKLEMCNLYIGNKSGIRQRVRK